MPQILFPSEPFSPRSVDPDFEHELAAARQSGLATALVDHTRVLQGAAAEAVARTPEKHAAAIYRGWMLTPDQYRSMHAALRARGVTLINSPEAYRTCHHLPDSYPFIENRTPRSVWVPVQGSVDFDAVRQALAPFHQAPLVVKDYVKSQKHYWTEACFIPAADDAAAVERVVKRFLELQGEDLNEGLVFREFVQLKIVGEHPKSRVPLAAEFRTFWLDGELLLAHRGQWVPAGYEWRRSSRATPLSNRLRAGLTILWDHLPLNFERRIEPSAGRSYPNDVPIARRGDESRRRPRAG